MVSRVGWYINTRLTIAATTMAIAVTRDKYHFQKWVIAQIDGFVTTKRTADGGIDGRIYFPLSAEATDPESMVPSVKGGRNVGIADLRDLAGVSGADEAAMAGLIMLHPLGEQKVRNSGCSPPSPAA